MNNRIVKILTNEGLSPSKFSDKIGVTRSSISHILSGRNKPSLEVIKKILINYKNINPEWLILGKDSMYKTNEQPSLFDNSNTLNKKDPINNKISEEPINKPFEDIPKEVKIENIKEIQAPRTKKQSAKRVQKIVTFYTDKTFEEYFPVE
ncbi:MAG: helix-turn-helix transcriptional regulator [Bacteroidetes bacterium]|nr:helix-turn-helix transcriptional regulator [Bacteroidota bacterium]